MKKRETLYMQVYGYYKNLIEGGYMNEGERLPSIRRCAEEREVSKTTVEQAYMCLCDDGYVVPKNQSGYYVSGRGRACSADENEEIKSDSCDRIAYDLSSSGVDADSFDLNVWRRYVKSALRQNERLLFYGEPQGEEDLREEIARYARGTRNCVCSADSIVIGAGVQTLLNILCPLLGTSKAVAFDDLSYSQGTAVFRDHGYTVTDEREKGDILYVSPSYASGWGDTMSVSERFSLTEYARANNKLIIEDDYGSEFRYFNRPTPSLQGLDGGESTVYLGTFSKLLLPSIRISFMILPHTLLSEYRKRGRVYNQTVSKSEQIALCSYIRDGHLQAQIRKSRNLYSQKAKLLTDILTEELGSKITVHKSNSPLYVRCSVSCGMTSEELTAAARKRGLAIISAGGGKKNAEIALSVSSLSTEKFKEAVKILSQTVNEYEKR